MAGEPLQCSKKKCGGWVKPDIVFFGEGLPERFHTLIQEDFDKCDLCITMGTSLYVQERCSNKFQKKNTFLRVEPSPKNP